ncbi:MAG TPA: HicB family protein [Clostridiales bacterium]|nr:HicB family protein [Clostridiales bacterium]
MRKLMYLAVLEPSENGGYGVYFPSFPGCISYGEDLEDALKNAKEALELHVFGMEKDGEELPPSGITVGEKDRNGMGIFITIYPDMVADEMNNRRVKTNVTIPAWLKDMAEKRGDVNLSKLLERALREYLGLDSISRP